MTSTKIKLQKALQNPNNWSPKLTQIAREIGVAVSTTADLIHKWKREERIHMSNIVVNLNMDGLSKRVTQEKLEEDARDIMEETKNTVDDGQETQEAD